MGKRTAIETRTTIPVMEEDLQVDKRTVETGVTRITKKVRSVDQSLEVPLVKDTVEVVRVPVERFVDHPVEVRTEDDTIVIPVLEEVLVAEKKLFLKEELHVRRRKEVAVEKRTETVRKEEAVVEHLEVNH